MGELVGTMILIIFGGGVVAGNLLKFSKGENGGWIVITIAWGLAVTMGIYAVGDISGAHLNPAVSVAMAVAGSFAWADVPMYILAQLLGAMLGAAIVYVAYLPHWGATDDQGAKLGVFATSPAIPHSFSNVLAEFIGTFVLILGLLMIGANEFTDGLNPLVVGLLIVAIGMSLGGPTGYAINPARDLGPRLMHFLLPIAGKGDSHFEYAWVPIVGPIAGGVFGALFYKQVFLGEMSIAFWIALVIVIAVIVFAQLSLKTNKGGQAS